MLVFQGFSYVLEGNVDKFILPQLPDTAIYHAFSVVKSLLKNIYKPLSHILSTASDLYIKHFTKNI